MLRSNVIQNVLLIRTAMATVEPFASEWFDAEMGSFVCLQCCLLLWDRLLGYLDSVFRLPLFLAVSFGGIFITFPLCGAIPFLGVLKTLLFRFSSYVMVACLLEYESSIATYLKKFGYVFLIWLVVHLTNKCGPHVTLWKKSLCPSSFVVLCFDCNFGTQISTCIKTLQAGLSCMTITWVLKSYSRLAVFLKSFWSYTILVIFLVCTCGQVFESTIKMNATFSGILYAFFINELLVRKQGQSEFAFGEACIVVRIPVFFIMRFRESHKYCLSYGHLVKTCEYNSLCLHVSVCRYYCQLRYCGHDWERTSWLFINRHSMVINIYESSLPSKNEVKVSSEENTGSYQVHSQMYLEVNPTTNLSANDLTRLLFGLLVVFLCKSARESLLQLVCFIDYEHSELFIDTQGEYRIVSSQHLNYSHLWKQYRRKFLSFLLIAIEELCEITEFLIAPLKLVIARLSSPFVFSPTSTKVLTPIFPVDTPIFGHQRDFLESVCGMEVHKEHGSVHAQPSSPPVVLSVLIPVIFQVNLNVRNVGTNNFADVPDSLFMVNVKIIEPQNVPFLDEVIIRNDRIIAPMELNLGVGQFNGSMSIAQIACSSGDIAPDNSSDVIVIFNEDISFELLSLIKSAGSEHDEDESEDDDSEAVFTDPAMGDVYITPGGGSGCIVITALVRNNLLYVASVGDSRCVLSRDGTAVEMSEDRIVKAGDEVTADGIVNGGLNLSRDIGDHLYKKNENLSPEEQMVTALSDIRTHEIDIKKDQFFFFACDGIWNSMNNQEERKNANVGGPNSESNLDDAFYLSNANNALMVLRSVNTGATADSDVSVSSLIYVDESVNSNYEAGHYNRDFPVASDITETNPKQEVTLFPNIVVKVDQLSRGSCCSKSGLKSVLVNGLYSICHYSRRDNIQHHVQWFLQQRDINEVNISAAAIISQDPVFRPAAISNASVVSYNVIWMSNSSVGLTLVFSIVTYQISDLILCYCDLYELNTSGFMYLPSIARKARVFQPVVENCIQNPWNWLIKIMDSTDTQLQFGSSHAAISIFYTITVNPTGVSLVLNISVSASLQRQRIFKNHDDMLVLLSFIRTTSALRRMTGLVMGGSSSSSTNGAVGILSDINGGSLTSGSDKVFASSNRSKDSNSARRDFLKYKMFMTDVHLSEPYDSMPVLGVSPLKHLVNAFNAFIYYIQRDFIACYQQPQTMTEEKQEYAVEQNIVAEADGPGCSNKSNDVLIGQCGRFFLRSNSALFLVGPTGPTQDSFLFFAYEAFPFSNNPHLMQLSSQREQLFGVFQLLNSTQRDLLVVIHSLECELTNAELLLRLHYHTTENGQTMSKSKYIIWILFGTYGLLIQDQGRCQDKCSLTNRPIMVNLHSSMTKALFC